jgi:hypothetical protein
MSLNHFLLKLQVGHLIDSQNNRSSEVFIKSNLK